MKYSKSSLSLEDSNSWSHNRCSGWGKFVVTSPDMQDQGP